MEIFEYTPEMQRHATQFYNNLTVNVPHCYPVSEDELGEVLQNTTYKTEDKKVLQSQTTFVAREQGTISGFIQVGIGPDEELNKNNIGIIRFLGYQPGERRAGQALLEKAESYLSTYNPELIVALPQDYRYRFYHFGHAYLSDALGHVQALLGYNGYQRRFGEVFLAWENYTVTPIQLAIPIELTVEWKPGRGERPNCTVQAFHDGTEVGICDSVSGGEFSDHPDAQDWLHTMWLGIKDEFQGRGLGRYLLQYILHEMHNIGYRHALISTSWDNYRAALFYSNFGYQVTDWTYGYLKTEL